MTASFLLEIGVEELPARFVPGALEQLKETMIRWLKEQRLEHGEVRVFGTPRRLALRVSRLASRQEDRVMEVRGPSLKAAKDPEGRWTRAAEGFAKAQGVSTADLIERDTPQGTYVFVRKHVPGADTVELLTESLPSLVLGLSFPKTMRWGEGDVRFARPIRWLVALYGGQPLDVEVAGVKSGSRSFGHRTLHPEAVSIPDPDEYESVLEQAFVMVDVEKRRKEIVEQVNREAASLGGRAVIEEDLLEEIVHLVEWPTAFAGRFDPAFLEVPPEVIMLTMKEHQRYFPVVREDGSLVPGFVGVRNGGSRRLDLVRAGNEKVLRARLADAKFFFDEDRRTTPDGYMAKLRHVVFQEGAGSLYDKVERVRRAALELAERLGASRREVSVIERAGQVLKFDLATHMVYEFPELEGVMGRYYALAAGEEQAVADAILQHHRPRFAGDGLPEALPAVYLALADKADTLCASFMVGIRPTGSEDPYGLRRNALGLLQILRYREVPVSVPELLDLAGRILVESGVSGEGDWRAELDAFIATRLRTWLLEEGFRHDLVDAVLCRSGDPVAVLARRVRFYQHLSESGRPELSETAEAAKRVHNLAKKGEEGLDGPPEPALFEDDAERDLFDTAMKVRDVLFSALDAADDEAALRALTTLNGAVHPFFDRVMVLVEDAQIRENRLRLLRMVAGLYDAVLDWRAVVAG
ncbi:MAG: glycine--tRNA ligase subunit beta [Alicyclobacillaceae bacterium]|nr:glycine--tRNA ligase subunit beta [Alicyclobacillaceae bacterium]